MAREGSPHRRSAALHADEKWKRATKAAVHAGEERARAVARWHESTPDGPGASFGVIADALDVHTSTVQDLVARGNRLRATKMTREDEEG